MATPNFRIEIQEILDLLSQHLGGYIQSVVEPLTGESDWTVLLTEVDRARGRSPKEYSQTDVQSQLRMLTERLGALGYPFTQKDQTRMLSIYAGELRVIRNSWAHGGSFDVIDVFRAADTVVRLFEQVELPEGSRQAEQLRDRAKRRLAEDEVSAGLPVPPLADVVTEKRDAGVEVMHEVSHRKCASDTPFIGDERLPFEPWQVVNSGPQSTLDQLRSAAAREKVRAVIEEIVEQEGPVSLERLARLVVASFNFSRLHENRLKQIRHQVNVQKFVVDNDQFVWPAGIESRSWHEYRPSMGEFSRDLRDVSPVEMANALLDIVSQRGHMRKADLDRLALNAFGKKKMTQKQISLVDQGYKKAKHRGLLVANGMISMASQAI